MDRFRVRRHSSLLECLGERRVCVARPGDVLRRSAVLDSQGGLGDHLAGVGTDDVHAEDAVRLSVGDELDNALGIEVRLGARVSAERECAHAVFGARGLDLGLVLAHPCDLRVRVHHARDRAVVDVAVALGDVLDRRDSLLLGLVRKHRAERAVADDADVRRLAAVFLVDDQTALLVLLHARVLQVQALGVWPPADGDEHGVCVQGLLLAALGGLDVESDGRAAIIALGDLGTGLELDALLAEDLLRLLGDLRVHTGSANLVQELDNRDLRSETRPHRRHLQTDDATTDDDHLLGDLRQLERAGAGDDALLVDGQAGEGCRLAPGGNEDVLPAHGLLTALQHVDLDSVLIDKRTCAFQVVDVVLLQQELDTLGQPVYRAILGLHHLRKVELDITDVNTALFRVVQDLVVKVGVVEQGL